jgi:hypothetical protein|tara:strand:+ start:123 stop:386 length:264 start_codon:yes stop_codon:yes gene_type:complete
MIKNVSPTKLYGISDNYNLVVIEDSEGELHNLVFSNSEILKGRLRGSRYSHKVPEYRLKFLDCTEVFVVSTLVSLVVGILTGWFLGL